MELTAEIILKYKGRTLPSLIKKAVTCFHAYIRQRDEGKPCVSCGFYHNLEAGHFYSAGKYAALRFDERNVHGQCKSCNYFKAGDLLNYRKHIVGRIGAEELKKIDDIARITLNGYKINRFNLIEIIEKYKSYH